MSEPNPEETYKDELAAGALGYGNGVAGCTFAVFWVKAISERDLPLVVVMLLSTGVFLRYFRAGLDAIELMTKEDGVRQKELESIFRRASRFATVQFIVMFKLFILG